MNYTVTTRRIDPLAADARSPMRGKADPATLPSPTITDRRDGITLDAAADIVWHAIHGTQTLHRIRKFIRDGRTLELPDGTTITVEVDA